TYGIADGQFNSPSGVAVDSSGKVYVADSLYNRIQKFSSSGAFITKWGYYGTADGQFTHGNPLGVAVDPSGNVYVPDNLNNRIQVFAPKG
nr:SMP-30/gluconolactonase/LRE family protein [Thermoproteota archaeon]